MKRVDKLVLKSFLGPFFLTFLVVIFILLSQFMLKYFDDFVGKGLGVDVYLKLFGYFSINMTPNAFPLAVLLSSLMTFGNLGEHSELTALKSAGVSLTRAMSPIFVFSILLTIIAFLSNNFFVPKANLKAYSLLYDIKQKTPALNIKEGAFYSDIPGYQIKVNKKFPDGRTLKDIIIYNHVRKSGNTEVTLADSGRMYNFLNDRYLVIELFDGNYYSKQELKGKRRRYKNHPEQYVRNKFKQSKMVFSMASFDMKRTREELFSGSRYMKSVKELSNDIDSMRKDIKYTKWGVFNNFVQKFDFHMRKDSLTIPNELIPENYGRSSINPEAAKYEDLEVRERTEEKKRNQKKGNTSVFSSKVNEPANTSTAINKEDRSATYTRSNPRFTQGKQLKQLVSNRTDQRNIKKNKPAGPYLSEVGADSLINGTFNMKRILKTVVSNVRYIKNDLMAKSNKVKTREFQIYRFDLQRNTILAQAFACITMFLIGAPLGSIIKKGGIGFPVLFSILFFIVYYVFMMIGAKWVKEGLMEPFIGAWLPNFVLFPFGLFFLRQARIDARLFDTDFYNVMISKILSKIKKNR